MENRNIGILIDKFDNKKILSTKIKIFTYIKTALINICEKLLNY